MPPYVPEEVDVFSVPHSRMKELVKAYAEMVNTPNRPCISPSLLLSSDSSGMQTNRVTRD